MKIKAGEISGVLDGLNQVADIDIPIKVAYWFARTAKQLQPEVQAFEQARMKLLKKHGKKDKKGELATDKNDQVQWNRPEDAEAFSKEFKELAEQEAEIKMDPISIDRLGEIDIKPEIIYKLFPLMKDDEEDKKKE